MRKGVITVILPIYNVEKYLNRCITSVVNQTYSNLEIILVDDGSPDRCPQICDEWSKKDNRIKVIHKKNEGLGFARNTGIENSTGEFICFFDSDDYVALDTVEKAYRVALKEKAEIVTFGYNQVKSDGKIKNTFIPHPRKLLYEGDEIQREFLINMIGPNMHTGEVTNLWMSMCGALFSMKLIQKNGWRLVSEREIISEDIYSLLILYKRVKKVAVLPESLYFYCENVESLTHTYKKDRYEKIKHFYSACLKTCDDLNYCSEVQQQLKYPFLSNTIAAMKMVVSAENQSEKEKLKILKNIIEDEILQKVLHEMPLEKERPARRLLLSFIRKKRYRCCYFLIKAKVKQ